MFEILKTIQADMTLFGAEASARFDKIGDLLHRPRCATAGLFVIAKSVAGHSTEELAAIEVRARVLEAPGR